MFLSLVPWCFGSLMVLGGAFLLITLIIGEVTEAAGGFLEDIDSALESFGIDLIPDAGDIDAEGGGVKGIGCAFAAAFLTGFGALGLFAWIITESVIMSTLLGLASGVLIGGIYLLLFNLFIRQEATESIRTEDFEGLTARITINTKPGETSQGIVVVKGHRLSYPVHEVEGKELLRGDQVKVVKMEGGQLIVEKQ